MRLEVLIIDDDKLTRWSLGSVLARAGYDVREARTAAEGLTGVRERAPHLVFLDVHLPDGGGASVLRMLREVQPTLPVVVMSADLPRDDARRLCQSGAQGYLAKPCAPPLVVALADSLLRPLAGRSETGRPVRGR